MPKDNQPAKHDQWYSKEDNPVGHITGAISLISIGIVFLLITTTEQVSWGVWLDVIRIFFVVWPVFLIFAGLRLVFGKSIVTKIIFDLLGTLFFVGVLFFAVAMNFNPEMKDDFSIGLPVIQDIFDGQDSGDQISKNFEVSADEYGAEELASKEISMKITSGKVQVEDAKKDDYFKVAAKYYENHGVPVLTSDLNQDDLEINFEQEFEPAFNWSGSKNLEYDVTLGATSIPTKLSYEITAGDVDIDLSETKLEQMSIDMTAGDLSTELSEESIPEDMEISITAGNFMLKLPEEVGIKLEYEVTAGSIKVNGDEIKAFGDGTYYFNEEAEKQVTIQAKLTAGEFTINQD